MFIDKPALTYLFHCLRKKWYYLVIGLALGSLLTFYLTWKPLPNQYVSSVRVTVNRLALRVNDYRGHAALYMAAESVNSEQVAREIQTKLGLYTVSLQEIRDMLSISVYISEQEMEANSQFLTSALYISATSAQPALCAPVANAAADAVLSMVETNFEAQLLMVMEEAVNVRLSFSGQNYKRSLWQIIPLCGLAAGLMVLLFTTLYVDTRVRIENVQSLPGDMLLGVIPQSTIKG